MGSIGAVVLLIEYIVVGFENIFYLLFIPIMIVLMYVLFQLRLIFGGADAKALMALAILIPIQPHILQFPLLEGTILSMPGSWIVFSNSILLFLCIPLSLLLFNIVKRNVKFPHCVLGYKMSVNLIQQKN